MTKIKIKLLFLLFVIIVCVILALCSCWKAMFYTLLVLGVLVVLSGVLFQLRHRHLLKFIGKYIVGAIFLAAAIIVAYSTHCL